MTVYYMSLKYFNRFILSFPRMNILISFQFIVIVLPFNKPCRPFSFWLFYNGQRPSINKRHTDDVVYVKLLLSFA